MKGKSKDSHPHLGTFPVELTPDEEVIFTFLLGLDTLRHFQHPHHDWEGIMLRMLDGNEERMRKVFKGLIGHGLISSLPCVGCKCQRPDAHNHLLLSPFAVYALLRAPRWEKLSYTERPMNPSEFPRLVTSMD